MAVTKEFFKEYGEALLKAVGFTDCKQWYGPLFVEWYNTTHVFGKEAKA